MHEFTMTHQIIEAVQREVRIREARAVAEVRLSVGNLTMLSLPQMRFAYEILTKNTQLEGSRLTIEEKDAVVKCPKCKYEGPIRVEEDPAFHITFPTLSCPNCSQVVDIIAGRECTVESVRLIMP